VREEIFMALKTHLINVEINKKSTKHCLKKVNKIEKNIMRWFGHVERMNDRIDKIDL
jgi:hypothetical protein